MVALFSLLHRSGQNHSSWTLSQRQRQCPPPTPLLPHHTQTRTQTPAQTHTLTQTTTQTQTTVFSTMLEAGLLLAQTSRGPPRRRESAVFFVSHQVFCLRYVCGSSTHSGICDVRCVCVQASPFLSTLGRCRHVLVRSGEACPFMPLTLQYHRVAVVSFLCAKVPCWILKETPS